jgi:phosphate acetyltransferase
MKSFFIAATGQNVGKTTTCLGLVAGMKQRDLSVGFLKPVGQNYSETEEGTQVDKDVLLFKSYFKLTSSYEEMSPVLFPRGFTRDYLDGKIDHHSLVKKITESFQSITSSHDITIVEGTGHTGVGSIVDLNNAQVAALLGSPLILVASGGLGSCFDELVLNLTQCEKYGVPVAGVILNRVLDAKREMVIHYMTKALRRLDIPLLGAIPYDPFLSHPTMQDFELLFQTKLLTGEEFRLRHFHHIRIIATSVEIYQTEILPHQLIVTPASREDIVLSTLTRYWDLKISHSDEELAIGMILTGKEPPSPSLVEKIRRTHLPMLYIPISSFTALKMINSHTAKIRQEDTEKIREAAQIVSSHIDFDLLID